jgi:hypothetical protein
MECGVHLAQLPDRQRTPRLTRGEKRGHDSRLSAEIGWAHLASSLVTKDPRRVEEGLARSDGFGDAAAERAAGRKQERGRKKQGAAHASSDSTPRLLFALLVGAISVLVTAAPLHAAPQDAADAGVSDASSIDAEAPKAPIGDAGAALDAAPLAPTPVAAQPAAPSAPPPPPAPSFLDNARALMDSVNLVIKMFGDTGYAVRDNASWRWASALNPNPSTYYPSVNSSFYAPRLDLFGAAEVGRLSFLTEVMFEADKNSITVDLERLQIAWLFKGWLRVRAGRTHVAWGYYNDAYHHGNLYELTTARPYTVEFEDSDGILLAHNVGLGVDGTIEAGGAGAFRYDVEVGNGRGKDITSVPMQYAETKQPAANARLRWMPVDGLIIGVNGLRDLIPGLPSGMPGVPDRPDVLELVAGGHVVYLEHGFHVDVEGFAMWHAPTGGAAASWIYGGFAELGYSVAGFTPYVRPEYVRFPATQDIVFQYTANSAQGALVGAPSLYDATRDFFDLRVGLKWLAIPQLALKLEGQRVAHNAEHQEILTLKAAFGF